MIRTVVLLEIKRSGKRVRQAGGQLRARRQLCGSIWQLGFSRVETLMVVAVYGVADYSPVASGVTCTRAGLRHCRCSTEGVVVAVGVEVSMVYG